jgi:hypothetical protein
MNEDAATFMTRAKLIELTPCLHFDSPRSDSDKPTVTIATADYKSFIGIVSTQKKRIDSVKNRSFQKFFKARIGPMDVRDEEQPHFKRLTSTAASLAPQYRQLRSGASKNDGGIGFVFIVLQTRTDLFEFLLHSLLRRLAIFNLLQDHLETAFEKGQKSGNRFVIISFWHSWVEFRCFGEEQSASRQFFSNYVKFAGCHQTEDIFSEVLTIFLMDSNASLQTE